MAVSKSPSKHSTDGNIQSDIELVSTYSATEEVELPGGKIVYISPGVNKVPREIMELTIVKMRIGKNYHVRGRQ